MKLKARTKRILAFESFLIPALVVYLVIFIYPMFNSFFYSFTDFSMLKHSWKFVGFNNYIQMFSDKQVFASVTNTLFFAFVSTVAVNFIALLIAIFFDKEFRGANFLRMLIFSPAVVASLIVGYVWTFILSSSQYGLFNSFLMKLGLGTVSWFGDSRYAMLCIILVYVWQWTGWCMVIYQANLQAIPLDLYEAAEIDGANAVQRVTRITLPLMVTSVTVNTVLFMISGLKVYDVIISTTKGGPGFSTETFTTVLMQRVFGMSKYGYGSAIAVTLFIVILLITIFQLGVLNRWERKIYE